VSTTTTYHLIILRAFLKVTFVHRFPVEIIRDILEIAAKQSRPTAAILLRVSKRAYRWIIPLVLHAITLRREKLEELRGIGIMSMITDETRNLAKHVRILHLDFGCGDLNPDTYYTYSHLAWVALRRCSNVERLVIDRWPELLGQGQMVPRAAPWDVRMVQENPCFSKYQFRFPYMTHVTHFYYGKGDFFRDALGLLFSRVFNQVTHLAVGVVNFTSTPEDIPITVNYWLSRPSLQVFYVEYMPWGYSWRQFIKMLPDPEEVWEHLLAIEDKRFVVGNGLQTDLESAGENGETVWERVCPVRYQNWKEYVRSGAGLPDT
jgi:hypothetical protein